VWAAISTLESIDFHNDRAATLKDLAQAMRFLKSLIDSLHSEIKWLLLVESDSSFPKSAVDALRIVACG
jgi:hypothetical protein